MNRFSQLWGQRQGLDALVSGRSSDQLNISPNQRNQIQQIRNDGNQLIGQCLQIPESGGQRNQIINSIQSIVFNQSISVLDNAQIEQLIVNLGEPFQFADGGGTGTGIGAGTEAVAGTEAGDSFSSENGAIAASPSSGEGQEDGNGVGR